MRKDEIAAQTCSVARSASVIADAWSLLIIREALAGVTRFDDFVEFTGAQPSLVSNRLTKLTDAGVFEKRPYQERPVRHEYKLTRMGLDLQPVLMAMTRWGDTHFAGEAGPPLIYRHKTCGHDADPTMTCSHCGDEITAETTRVRLGPGAGHDNRARPRR